MESNDQNLPQNEMRMDDAPMDDSDEEYNRRMEESDIEEGVEYAIVEEFAEGSDSEAVEGENGEKADDSRASFEGHTDSVYSVDIFSLPNPGINAEDLHTMAISGGGDDKAFIWNVANGKTLFELAGHKDSVSSVRFNVDGTLAATGSYDGTVKIWDTRTGQLLQNLEGPGEGIEWLTWHPKGNVVLAGSSDGSCWMWLSNGTCMNVFAGHSAEVLCGLFTHDGKHIVTGSGDSTVRVWDPKTAASHSFADANFHSDAVLCVANASMNPAIIASGSADRTAKISNIHTLKQLGTLQGHEDAIETIGFSPNLPYVATGSLDKKLNIWDLNTLQLRSTGTHDGGVVKLLWHPTETAMLITCSIDKTLKLWDSRTANCVRTWRGHTNGILDFALSRDGRVIVTGADDQSSLAFLCLNKDDEK